ncbi:MAG: XrtA/PEP-CTERM system TPR-repeat protein PrsT [Gammaproteobacteria bacterium]
MTSSQTYPPRLRVLALSIAMALGAVAYDPVVAKIDDTIIDGDSLAWYEDALQKYHLQDYQGALRSIQILLTKTPGDLPGRLLLGRVHMGMGNAAAAEKELRAARAEGADPNLVLPLLGEAYLLEAKYEELMEEIRPDGLASEARTKVLVLRGMTQLRLRKRSSAEEIFNEAAEQAPDEAGPLLGNAVGICQGQQQELADEALARDPESAEAWLFKGEARWVQRDFEAAMAAFEQVLKLDDGHVEGRLGRAGILLDRGELDKALEDVEWVLERVKHDAKAHYLKAQIFQRQGKDELAKQVLIDADAILSAISGKYVANDPPSLLLLGLIETNQANWEAAINHLSRFVKLVPHHVGGRKLYGLALIRTNQPLSAAGILEPLKRYAPNDPGVYAMIAELNLEEGRPKAAVEMWEKAVSLNPENKNYRVRLALTRISAGDEQQGFAELEEAAADDPDNIGVQLMLGNVYLRQRAFDRAHELAERLLAQNPDNIDLLILAGNATSKLGRLDDAILYYERVLALNPLYHAASVNLAKIAMRQGKFDQARGIFNRILESDPVNAAAMYELSRISRKELDEAGELFWLEKATAADTDTLPPILRLIDLYIGRAEGNKAKVLIRQATTGRRDNPRLMEAQARIEEAFGEPKLARAAFRRLAQYGSDNGNVAWLIKAAQAQVRIKDYESALWSLTSVLGVNPDHYLAMAELAKLQMRRKEYEEATALGERLRDLYPKNVAGYRLGGDAAFIAGDAAAALEHYNRALEIEPSSSLMLRKYRALARLDRTDEGVAGLKVWLRRHPADLRARRIVAADAMVKGDLREAQEHLQALLDEQPKNGDVLNNLAWVYFKLRDDRAIGTAERAVDAAPDSASALDTLGWLLVEAGEPGRALPLLRQAVTRDSQSPVIRYHLAAALHRLGRVDEARRELDSALSGSEAFVGRDEARSLREQIEAEQ